MWFNKSKEIRATLKAEVDKLTQGHGALCNFIKNLSEEAQTTKADLSIVKTELTGLQASLYAVLNSLQCDLVMGTDNKPKLKLRMD